MAYGSPNSLEEVGEYLRQVRGGRLPTLEEVEQLRDRYRQVGGQTPLLEITLAQAKALEEGLLLLTCGIHFNVIRFLMPLTIPDAVFAEALQILERSIRAAAAKAA